ncbi:aminotransferase class III-fold pyridoxal phosphate-dependent enzyme [SAR202 cluster bacterium AD-812-D07_MRT_10900m]|nr:aminotransferase class III-fold pyridoxal phosphate-dependent enzyme [SAR202 cluster bacterium AD-812-D07_MRT_10900m]
MSRSEELVERARRVIPGISQTFSKNPNQYVRNVTPSYIERGVGGHIWDADGNEYIDYPLSLGPIILGHGDPDVQTAVRDQLEDGTIFSLPHRLEVEVSELLCEVIPCAEMVRFGKNGSDATSAAVRAARSFTRRDRVAVCGYHGWQDWYIGSTTRDSGVPAAVAALTHTFTYNDLASLEQLFHDHPSEIACVIMEPVGLEAPQDDFLDRVAEITRSNGALLIFDEVISGFRIALGGAQEYFGVTPDIGCFAKAMANGYPVSAVTGRGDVMKQFEQVFFSGTFGGETLSLAAAKATITKMQNEPVIERLWEVGGRLQTAYNNISADLGLASVTSCEGLAPHTVTPFTDASGAPSLALRSLLQQELAFRGILYLVGFNVCYAHTGEDVDITIAALKQSLAVVAEAVEQGTVEELLKGPAAEPVFRQP